MGINNQRFHSQILDRIVAGVRRFVKAASRISSQILPAFQVLFPEIRGIPDGKDDAHVIRMIGDRISFISAYCDSWCERCAFTDRCSSFAARAAIAMCGDVREGIELAVGRPLCADRRAPEPVPAWRADFQDVEVTPDELARLDQEEDERRIRLEETSLMKTAHALSELAREWLAAQPTELQSAADPVLGEALAVAQYDVHLFWVKLYRALDGRDREDDELFDDDPIQNDWNGSAKVALICIERSEAAWRVIAASTAQETPMAVADQFRDLRHEVEREFPDAWRFIRPGFDEPGR